MEKKKNTPKLRFPEFTGEWEEKKLGEVAIFKSGYAFKSEFMLSKKCKYQILKMSNVYQNELNLERNPSYLESIDEKQKDFLLRKGDSILTLTGTVGKKDFGYSVIINEDNKFLLNQRLVLLREIASISANGFINYILSTEKFLFFFFAEAKGGTGNQTNVSTEDVKNISLGFPHLSEQTKIATFLTAVDEKLTQLKKKKTLLEQYKKGVMQKLFSQELRFKDDNNQDFPDWEEKTLEEILVEHKTRNKNKDIKEVFSVAKIEGVVNQIDHLGRSYASSDTSNYKVVFPYDLIYTKSPTSDFPYGIIKQNKLKRTGIVFVLYGVFTPKSENIGLLLDYYFSNWKNTYNYLNPLVQKGAKNTMNINNEVFLNGSNIPLPASEVEQEKIATFLSTIDEKIDHCEKHIEQMEAWKKGLLQQMFC